MKCPTARRQACGGDVLVLRQRHGTAIRRAALEDGVPGAQGAHDGDGWVSSVPGLRIGVFVTDCQPLYLWDDEGRRAAGVFHAGWRGTAAGIGVRAVEALASLGVPPIRMAAAVGPHIGPCCYRVGEELAPRFRPESLERRDGALYLELAAELEAQLVEAGVPRGNIALSGDCTCCRPVSGARPSTSNASPGKIADPVDAVFGKRKDGCFIRDINDAPRVPVVFSNTPAVGHAKIHHTIIVLYCPPYLRGIVIFLR